jgi:hypothetical protein
MLKINKEQVSIIDDGVMKIIPCFTYFVPVDDVYEYKLNGVKKTIHKDIVNKSTNIFEDGDLSEFLRNSFTAKLDETIKQVAKSIYNSILEENKYPFDTWLDDLMYNYLRKYNKKVFDKIELTKTLETKSKESWTNIFFQAKDKVELPKGEWCPMNGHSVPLNWKPSLD